ncbi:hypothetical protein BDV95DRAFT_322258 [Massariosphaeria phaeospora]|uniref:C3H1-type domain-containing protein n=1 Tax=Massariosphaeria phaeospora TaxID=100035 RepID=A0A7C8MD77_9PLEO|nr:hypothetical protein BDV95DRAFT_322258 [Massariosphaeria phaeospora]
MPLPPAVLHGGPGMPRSLQSLADVLSDLSPAAPRLDRRHAPVTETPKPNKAAPTLDTTPQPSPFSRLHFYPHASVATDAKAYILDPRPELTSLSSSSQALAAEARPVEKAPRKRTKNPRRTKAHNSQSRWSRGAVSSDDTASERTASLSHSSSRSSPPDVVHPLHTHRSHTNIATTIAASYQGRLMATAFGGSSGDSRRGVASPRPKGREAKNTFCRNVTIYGHCRYENTCPYVHESSKMNQNENMKKRFNVDSPAFTPLQASTNGSLTPSSRTTATISPKAANAAIFTPKSARSSKSS